MLHIWTSCYMVPYVASVSHWCPTHFSGCGMPLPRPKIRLHSSVDWRYSLRTAVGCGHWSRLQAGLTGSNFQIMHHFCPWWAIDPPWMICGLPRKRVWEPLLCADDRCPDHIFLVGCYHGGLMDVNFLCPPTGQIFGLIRSVLWPFYQVTATMAAQRTCCGQGEEGRRGITAMSSTILSCSSFNV